MVLDTDPKLIGFYELGYRRIPVDKAKALAERYKDLDLNWLLLGKGTAPGGELADKVEALERQVAELSSKYASSPAGQSPKTAEMVDSILANAVIAGFERTLDPRPIRRHLNGMVAGQLDAERRQAIDEAGINLADLVERVIRGAAAEILEQFREFARKR